MTGSIRKIPGFGGKPNHGVGIRRRFNMHFDEDTVVQIRARALKGGLSFAECVRELVEIGLETEALEQ